MTTSFRRRIVRFLALSLMLHLVISSLVMISRRSLVQTGADERAVKIFPAALLIPGGTKTQWTPKPPGRKKHPEPAKQTTSDLAMSKTAAPAAGAPVSAPENTAAGNGADQQSADPAFPDFSPRPAVRDRSLLPSSNEQVIVDVKVSASGDVLDATLVQGIGNGLDRIVLDTVKTWHFHPATLNGSPVATEAELIFPFNGNYPIIAG